MVASSGCTIGTLRKGRRRIVLRYNNDFFATAHALLTGKPIFMPSYFPDARSGSVPLSIKRVKMEDKENQENEKQDMGAGRIPLAAVNSKKKRQ